MGDVIFVLLTLALFAASWGLIGVLDRLMEDKL